jgi:hypothetical protein
VFQWETMTDITAQTETVLSALDPTATAHA